MTTAENTWLNFLISQIPGQEKILFQLAICFCVIIVSLTICFALVKATHSGNR